MTLPLKLSTLLAIGCLAVGLVPAAQAQTPTDTWTNSFTLEGEPKYGLDYPHFDYVNVDAPKGGTVRLGDLGGFDTFNPILPKGEVAGGIGLLYETLMTPSLDENNTYYVHLAEALKIAPDYGAVTFRMDADAKWHDGEPVTAEDVVWTFEKLIEVNPDRAQYYANITSAEVTAPGEVTFTFNQTDNRELPLILGQLLVLPQHWWEGTNAEGETRSIAESTLEPPLGSGPYRLASFDAGRSITYERVKNYWARNLNVNVGRWNFGEIRFEYFRDRTAQFEAFKAGAYLLREEFTAKYWATEYNFPAMEDGRVKRVTLRDDTPSGAQGWFINLRREKFADPRLREALSYAFDFEWMNRNQFYGLYDRTESFFEKSPMKAEGLPSAAELTLLEPFRESLPPEVFGPPVTPPVSDGSGRDRAMLRRAAELMNEAGWTVENGRRVNEDGDVLSIEFVSDEPTWERIIAPYVATLRRLGVDANIRFIDSAQYQERLKSYDFDITVMRYSLLPTPGVELRSYWHSDFADQPGSRNLSGIANPAVDALIEKVIAAETREEQITAGRALDRVLRAGHYWVPQWYKALHHIAMWDRFGRPEEKPAYARGIIDTWWSKDAKE